MQMKWLFSHLFAMQSFYLFVFGSLLLVDLLLLKVKYASVFSFHIEMEFSFPLNRLVA